MSTTVAGPTKGELTRARILDAAIARFGRDGFRATSVADIARDAEVAGSAPYAYFADKQDLFLEAIDHDAAAVLEAGLDATTDGGGDLLDWHGTLFFNLIGAVDHHPLAGRLLAGREPEVTRRVLESGGLGELRTAYAERLVAAQDAGQVRSDIDVKATASGIVTILLSLLMSVVQLGPDVADPYRDDVVGVFRAALAPRPA
ncbi:TetR/AcrR family transcriptional regulator [Iamia majanohamensis]|uniref:TetR/AcrR family transcriptional regulator n=1 Tax=Iamia majanohamensis TaxID=467976 RepID=A0AAE9Y5B6_9ACTN|nr:TetR/AcrR family transcriptional regulator [Iamia majanohamensis]WCO66995.1 TetR/AcrR family transcriptional regulator [Iamia majanohamensis]